MAKYNEELLDYFNVKEGTILEAVIDVEGLTAMPIPKELNGYITDIKYFTPDKDEYDNKTFIIKKGTRIEIQKLGLKDIPSSEEVNPIKFSNGYVWSGFDEYDNNNWKLIKE